MLNPGLADDLGQTRELFGLAHALGRRQRQTVIDQSQVDVARFIGRWEIGYLLRLQFL